MQGKMSTQGKEKSKKPKKKITRRQLLKRIRTLDLTGKAELGKAVTGTIKYPWGTVSGATVTLADKSVVSDPAGKFEFAGLAPGVYNLVVRAPFPGYEAPPQTVEVSRSETRVMDVFLDFEKTVLEGHVCDQDKKPIAGAVVSGVLSGKDVVDTTTDPSGYFRFDEANPGYQFIRVNAKGFMGEVRDLETRKGDVTTADFQLTSAPCRLHGTVTGQDGKALRAEVVVRKSDIIIERTSSDAETGYFEANVLPGTYGILATAPGCRSEGWRGEVSTDTTVDFKLEPPVELRARPRLPMTTP